MRIPHRPRLKAAGLILLSVLFAPAITQASVIVPTGCGVLLTPISSDAFEVADILPFEGEAFDERPNLAASTERVGYCQRIIPQEGVDLGDVVSVDESDKAEIMLSFTRNSPDAAAENQATFGQAYALESGDGIYVPLESYSGTNSPSGPVAGGLQFVFRNASAGTDAVVTVLEPVSVTDMAVGDDDEERRGLMVELVSVLQQLVSLLQMRE